MLLPILLLLALTVVLGAGYIYEKSAGKRDWYEQFQPPGRRIDTGGGRRWYYWATGERHPGLPIVVLEAGHGDWSKCWAEVQPEIARYARVLSYDRAGSGWSDPGSAPRTPIQMVRELHNLLERAGESGPYLLVGHSMGAALSRLFFQRYPQEVTGMVWVDSAHERMEQFIPFLKITLPLMLFAMQLGRLVARLGITRLAGKHLILRGYPFAKEKKDQTEFMAQVSGAKYFDWFTAETAAFFRSDHWPDNSASLGNLLVISIEAQYSQKPSKLYPPKQWREFLTGWRAIQEDACGRSSCVERIPVQTGHAVMHEAPLVVVEAVRLLLERSNQ